MLIKQSIIEAMFDLAKKESPYESCGYLAAKDDIITDMYALTNIDKSKEHFSFDPKEQFAAVRDARHKGLGICAVYHSHPMTPARPSEEDIRLAHDPDIHYVIVSLMGGEKTVRSFRIRNSRVEHEDIEIVE